MSNNNSYRDSHKDHCKGVSYDDYYRNAKGQSFLWSQEQKVLSGIIDSFYKDRQINYLDFACGTGRITSVLESKMATSTGVDVSGSMLKEASEKLKHTEIIKADITRDDVLSGKKFDLITAFRFFVNAEPELRTEVIKALAPLLSEDGYLVFNNHQNSGSLLIKWSKMRHYKTKPDGLYNVMTIKQMHELAESAGLEIVKIYPIGFFYHARIPIPMGICRLIDGICCKFKFLEGFSQSPIAVCRHKKG